MFASNRILRLPVRFALLAGLAFATSAFGATPFVVEVVDTTGSVGTHTSVAVDAQGNPHIAYMENANGDIKHAAKSGGAWVIQVIHAGTGLEGYPFSGLSLKLDGSGNPRVAYTHRFNSASVNYAAKSAGTWTIEVVDANGFTPSLALDSQGNPHIAYYSAGPGTLKYAHKSGGVWTLETVDARYIVGFTPSIAIDAAGNPHISYVGGYLTGSLEYAVKSAGSWSIETVDNTVCTQLSSLVLDANDNARIAYLDCTNADLRYASRAGGAWTIETADAVNGTWASLALDEQGNPHIGYALARYAVKSGGTWTREIVDGMPSVGEYTSLALDGQGNPRMSYYDPINKDLRYADAAVRVVSPAAGATWPVGALRDIEWKGLGPVSISLSTDGGASYQTLLAGVVSSPVRIRVPHAPTRFARVRVERSTQLSTAFSESLFTIQTSVALLALLAAPAPNGARGAVITWQSDPGPEDLAGYRLERASSASEWRTLVALTRETSATDPDGGPGSRYRLFAVNGLGEELWLGETSLRPAVPLAAWPLPYRGGNLSISFATVGGLGGGAGRTEVAIFDVSGRLVRTIARGEYAAGYQSAVWDGRDGRGGKVSAGVYFLRTHGAYGEGRSIKLAVLR